MSSRLLPLLPPRLLIVPGLGLAAVGAALLTWLTAGVGCVTGVLPSELLVGLGLGLSMVPFISTATANAAPQDAGVTAAATTTFQQVGASIGMALMNTITATATASYLTAHAGADDVAAHAAVHGYAVASGSAAGVLVVAALLGGILINARSGRIRAELPPSPSSLIYRSPGELTFGARADTVEVVSVSSNAEPRLNQSHCASFEADTAGHAHARVRRVHRAKRTEQMPP